jgi:hypothetical protein
MTFVFVGHRVHYNTFLILVLCGTSGMGITPSLLKSTSSVQERNLHKAENKI